jgi:type 1 glutamine amidotransferase
MLTKPLIVLAPLLVALTALAEPPPKADEAATQAVLVFSRTAGFRHGSIPAGIEAVKRLGREHGFKVDATEDPAKFVANLSDYDAVVFLNTTGDVLNDDQQKAMESFVRAGNGFVGVHSATDTEYDWPWYGRLVGAYFAGHPRIQEAEIEVVSRNHPSTRHLSARWTRVDEWYNFRESPTGKVTVLARLDESTYEGGTMPDDHPVSWCHEYDGGRAWYTAGGHTNESFAEPSFLRHLLGGIKWAMGEEEKE